MKAPHASIARIKVFIKQWKKVRQQEISSKICKTEIQLRSAHFQEVDEILELFGKWRFALIAKVETNLVTV